MEPCVRGTTTISTRLYFYAVVTLAGMFGVEVEFTCRIYATFECFRMLTSVYESFRGEIKISFFKFSKHARRSKKLKFLEIFHHHFNI